jgi:hypothetical protein
MLLRIGIALIGLGVLAGVAGALIWGLDGPDWRDNDVEYRIVNDQGQQTDQGNVIVVDRDGRDGPPFFFPAFPLVIVGGVLITIALVTRGGRGGWGGPRGRFDEWHREAHRGNGAPPSPPSSPAAS